MAKSPSVRAKPAAAASGRRLCSLAAQLYTVRDHLGTTKELDASLKRVAKIGYRHVQLCAFPGTDHGTAKILLDKHGLTAIGQHAGYQELVDHFDEVVERMRLYGIDHTTIPYIGAEFRGSIANWKKTAKSFQAMGAKLAKAGIQLQYHNHAFEFERFQGKTGLEWLYENTDPRFLKAELDLAWVARGFQSPAAWIERLSGRIDQLHFKDITIANAPDGAQRDKLAEIGNGNLDWAAIAQAARKAKVMDLVVEQDHDFLGGCPFK